MNLDRLKMNGIGMMLGGGLRAMAWEFSRRTDSARQVAESTLDRILALNGSAEFWRQRGLGGANARAAFLEQPLTAYPDYAPFIERAANGETGVLTRDPIKYFLVTSGTTGVPKLVPVTSRQSRVVAAHMLAAMGFAIREGTLGPMRGPWMVVLSTPPTVKTSGGIEKSTVSNAVVAQVKGIFDHVLSSPYPIMQTTGVAVTRYLHFLFALREPDLWCIVSPYPAVLLSGFRNLALRAPEFLRDLADGTISSELELTAQQRQEFGQLLGRHPARARALSALLERGEFVAGRIWPKLGALLTANSGAYHFYTDQLEQHLGGVKIFSPSFAASEGVVGIGTSANERGYVVSPSGAYVEFLPAGDASADPSSLLRPADLEVGRVYEVVVTTYAGLVRYRMGDLVKVLGWRGQSPVVDFMERRGQLLDVVGEKVTEAQVNEAFAAACSQSRMKFVDYVLTIDGHTLPPRYLLIVEFAELGGTDALRSEAMMEFLKLFDFELRERSLYKIVRKVGALLPMAALSLDRDSFERFNEHRLKQGASLAQLKMPHVVSDPTFASRHFRNHARLELPDDRQPVVASTLY